MDGIVVVNKPQGFTSHDVVDLMRRKFDLKKVGHAGTLDPMATGVLVMLIGKYTKSSDSVMAGEKEYRATLVLGATSDTGDAWGAIKDSGCAVNFKNEDISRAFKKFLGRVKQVPPMYSAVKVGGKKLYKLARKGLSATVKPRDIFIKSIDILEVSLPRVSFTMVCSKGTYVRQVCVDIGSHLGCGAYLSQLARTRAGSFTIEQAITVEELRNLSAGDLEKRLLYL